MDLVTSSYERALRRATCYSEFMRVCHDIVETSDHVRIDRKAVDTYAASLSVPNFINGWDDYVTPRNKSLWSRSHDFVELAVNTSVNAGYLYRSADGKTAKWELNGSGAAMLVAKMNEVRNMGALPAIHLKTPDEVCARLSDVFNGAPFAQERLAIWGELAQPRVISGLRELLYSTREHTKGKQHHFSFDHIKGLADMCPAGFGEDPFLKKAALLPILYAGLAHNKIAPGSVTMDPVCAADYRLPQTDHNIGLLRLSDDLVDRLDKEELMHQGDRAVMDMRAATWVINDLTLASRPDLQSYYLDGDKWFAGRLFDKPIDALDEKKQKIRKGLESISQNSGFDEPGFNRKASKPMAVYTMRF